MTEPLPLVPATWTTGGRRRSGWPRRSSRRQVRSSERSMILGCSLVSSSRTRSLPRPFSVDEDAGEVGSVAAGSVNTCWDIRVTAGGDWEADHLGRRRRMAEQVDEADQRVAQLAPRHHHVDHAVLAQIFGALEALRQLLADR